MLKRNGSPSLVVSGVWKAAHESGLLYGKGVDNHEGEMGKMSFRMGGGAQQMNG